MVRHRNMPTHRIRLAGPWELQTLDDQSRPVGEAVRSQLPFELRQQQHKFGVLLIRGFHRPTGIDEATRLRIAMKTNANLIAVRINSKLVTVQIAEFQDEVTCEITDVIQEFNQLSVQICPDASGADSTLEAVWLEIH